MIIYCIKCGKPFSPKKKTSKFCSHKCYWKHKKGTKLSIKTRIKMSIIHKEKYKLNPRAKKIEFICKQCKKIFMAYPCHIPTKHFCSRKCMYDFRKGKPSWNRGKKLSKEHIAKMKLVKRPHGEKANNWRGGISYNKIQNRISIYSKDHPHRSSRGYVVRARFVAEQCLGRFLEIGEIVHHIDFNTMNDSAENLFVFENRNEHIRYHLLLKNNPFLKTWLESNLCNMM